MTSPEERAEAPLLAALEAAGIGTWSWIVPADEIRGSSVTARIHGLEQGDLSLTLADYERMLYPEDRGRVVAALRQSAEQGTSFETEYRIQRPDGSLRWVRNRGLGFAPREGAATLTGVCWDVTEEKQREREVAVQHTVAQLVSSAGDLREIGPDLLRTLSDNLGWDYGELWLLDESSARIEPLATWYRDENAGRRFEEATRQIEFTRGRGIPGAVWESGEVLWERDLAEHPEFPRAALARELGFHSAVGFPIVVGDSLRGVLVFYARHIEERDEHLTRMFGFVGSQLGQHLERREASSALKASEARYRALAETASDAILTVDRSGTLVYANAAAERIFGYNVEEMTGQPLSMLMPERFRDRHDRGFARYTRTGEKRIPWSGVELPGLHRDGHELPLEIAFSEFTSGEDRFITGVARDISERKRDAEALTLLADASKALSESLDTGRTLRIVAELCVPRIADWCLIDLVDDAGQLNRVVTEHQDPAMAQKVSSVHERLSWKADAPAGPVAVVRTASPELRQVDDEMLRSLAIDEQHLALLRELDLVSWMSVPLHARGRVLGTLTLATSGSRRVYDEHDLAVAADLGVRVFIAIENARLYSTAQNLNRAKDEFLAQLSHELKTPITAVLGYARLIEQGDLEADQLREAVESIRASAEAQARLVEDLLDVSRAVMGKFNINPVPVDLKKVVDAAVAVIHPAARAKRIHLVSPAEDAPCTVLGDPSRLQQVIWNLLSNAVKFTPSGGEIRIEIGCRNGDAVVEISDTGEGIAADFLPHMFDPFAQGAGGQEAGGLGLGLSVVRHLIELHGGQIEAFSDGPGEGATFRISLPIRRSSD